MWVGLYICLVILEQMIELDLERAFSRHVVNIEVGSVGRDARSRLHSKGICTGQTLGGENVLEWLAVGGGWVGPEFADTRKGWGQTFVVRVTRLREDAGNPLGVFGGHQQPDRSTEIEEVDCEFLQADGLGELVNRVGYVDKGVLVFIGGRARGIAKPWIVGRDDVKLVGNEGDQIAEGVRARGVAMEEDYGWERWVPGFAVEDVEVVNFGRPVLDNERHNESSDFRLVWLWEVVSWTIVKGCAYRRQDRQCLYLEQIGSIMPIFYEELPLALAHLVNRGARYLMRIMESCLTGDRRPSN